MTESNVVQEVANRSLCCGCGVCAGICAAGALQMRFNLRRELVPTVNDACTNCLLCLEVCPALEIGRTLPAEELFGSVAEGQDRHVGDYAALFVGHSLPHRTKGASGGMLTWTLEDLFEKSKIDAAVCVARSETSDRLFEPVIVTSPSELITCASSKYYPVEFSGAVAHMMENEGRYAITALPCAVTAIRKAQRLLPRLRERIRYVLALACGHGVSANFGTFLLRTLGLKEQTLRDADFRYSGQSLTASNFALRARKAGGRWSRPLFFSGLYGRLWAGRFFVPQACDFCDDLFSPLADATFMDAWLPEFVTDPRGTSIVVARRAELAELLRRGTEEGACQLRSMDVEDIVRSQAGALGYKSGLLPLRVARAERDGLRIPRSFERVVPPSGIREKLASIKRSAHSGLERRVFDGRGRQRPFWAFLLTSYLRAQCLWRGGTRRIKAIRGRLGRPNSG